MIRTFNEMVTAVKAGRKKRIAVAMAQDKDVLLAVQKAHKEGLADAILVGEKDEINTITHEATLDMRDVHIEHVSGEGGAVNRAVELVRGGTVDVLMKGKCSTATFLKGILDKERGLRGTGTLSHLAAFEVHTYPKLILMSDAAMNIAPDLKIKIAICQNAIAAAHKLGISDPRVALVAAVEKVNHQSMPCTADAAVISKMAQRGQIKGSTVDGPLAIDNALSKKSCEIKGIYTTVGGDADILIMPNIEAGNCFYKTLTYLANAKCAGIVVGAQVPVVLSSRADSEETKFLSIAFALMLS